MTEHELTRRDAMVALSAAGVATVAGAALTWDRIDDSTDDRQLDGADRRKLHAIAEILYPSEVAGVRSFVDSYIAGRVQDRPERAAGISDSLGYLDSYTENWYGQSFLALPQDRRESVLRDMGADLTEPDPEGSDVERLRFYVVNELLFALYTSPTGGELVGIENPQGHPGGTTSYRQPPG
jgi:hypothetical protein